MEVGGEPCLVVDGGRHPLLDLLSSHVVRFTLAIGPPHGVPANGQNLRSGVSERQPRSLLTKVSQACVVL